MKDGQVQQVASPLEVYHRPANRFVATFIGSPPMNLLAGHIHEGRFESQQGNGQSLRVPVGDALPAGPAVLGFRPEDLLTDQEGIPLTSSKVRHLEYLGHEVVAHFDVAGHVCLARLGTGKTLNDGQPTPLSDSRRCVASVRRRRRGPAAGVNRVGSWIHKKSENVPATEFL